MPLGMERGVGGVVGCGVDEKEMQRQRGKERGVKVRLIND